MCKICKTCNESNFGVIVKNIEEKAARMINGQIVEFFEESEDSKEAISVKYCFTCCKEITDDDLIEGHICKVCKNKSEYVNKDGVCIECEKEIGKLLDASKEDLILMILKQDKKNPYQSFEKAKSNNQVEENKRFNKNQGILKNKKEKNKEKLVKINKKSDTIKEEEKSDEDTEIQKVEIDVGKAELSKRKRRCKSKDKINNVKKEMKREELNYEENIAKEEIECISKKENTNIKTLGDVKDNSIYNIEDVKDVGILGNIKENIDIYNINNEKVYNELVNNTLMEIENIINQHF